MYLLLRVSTGENWNGFMRRMIPNNENCDKFRKYNISAPWCLSGYDYPNCTEISGCGAGISVYVYFYSFTLLVSFVILNLFVGIVLEAFENSNGGDILSSHDMDHFTSCWVDFDPSATWCITVGSTMTWCTFGSGKSRS
jgi:voltage-dependent calcium channel L type alpha-1D